MFCRVVKCMAATQVNSDINQQLTKGTSITEPPYGKLWMDLHEV